MGMMTHTLLLTYHVTGEEKYLEPVRSMARIRLAYLESPPKQEPAAGSEAWCAARLGGLAEVVAKYRFLTGRRDFDALLSRETSPYVRHRLGGGREPLVAALRENAEALRINFPGYTSEVRYTDRVLRFPTLFEPDGITGAAVPAVRVPNPALLYSSVTGDPGTPEYFPLNAVRWLTPPRDIAALVTDSNADGFTTELFHFGPDDRRMGAEFYLLKPGTYLLTLTADESPEQSQTQEIIVTGPRTRAGFVLPARRLCVLRVQLRQRA